MLPSPVARTPVPANWRQTEMVGFSEDEVRLVSIIEATIRAELADCIVPPEMRGGLTDGALTSLCTCLARIAREPGSSAAGFRFIGYRQARLELRRAARLGKAGRSAGQLSGTSITALAAIGWRAEDFRLKPGRSRWAISAGLEWLRYHVPRVSNGRPPDFRAQAFAQVLGKLYSGLTGRPAHEKSAHFMSLLGQLEELTPSLRFGAEYRAKQGARRRAASQNRGGSVRSP